MNFIIGNNTITVHSVVRWTVLTFSIQFMTLIKVFCYIISWKFLLNKREGEMRRKETEKGEMEEKKKKEEENLNKKLSLPIVSRIIVSVLGPVAWIKCRTEDDKSIHWKLFIRLKQHGVIKVVVLPGFDTDGISQWSLYSIEVWTLSVSYHGPLPFVVPSPSNTETQMNWCLLFTFLKNNTWNPPNPPV